MSVEAPQQLTDHWSEEALNPERISALIAELTPAAEVLAGRTQGVHVIDGNDPGSDIGRYVEWVVFEKFFDNDKGLMKREYEPYDSSSVFLALIDYEKQQPAAVLRLIKPEGPNGLKSLNDMLSPQNPWYQEGQTAQSRLAECGLTDPHTMVDIGTMAVMPEYRSAHSKDGASATLYSSSVRWSLENSYPDWITIIDNRALRMIQAWGEPFLPFEDAGFEPYLGSKASRPMHLELRSGLQKIKDFDIAAEEATGNPCDVHGLYTRGAGLEVDYLLPDFELPEDL